MKTPPQHSYSPAGAAQRPDQAPANEGGLSRRMPPRYAALDLGTNNCRLLIAAPRRDGFRVIDAFSRIVRLGEGLSARGALSEDAMERTIDALRTCAEKIARRGVTRSRFITTQACRAASNGPEFLARIKSEIGLDLEIVSTEEEARLSVSGCADLIDAGAEKAIVFDIGGGSTEISFVAMRRSGGTATPEVAAWFSMPIGVVSLAEKWGGREISPETYAKIVESVATDIRAAGEPQGFRDAFADGRAHLLGTSGTVTSIAGVHLGLDRYRRADVDGRWLDAAEAREVSERLRAMSYDDRAAEPCIGRERADLVVCGCAILEGLQQAWPSSRIRVADRGLREGILAGLAALDRPPRRKRRGRRRSNRDS